MRPHLRRAAAMRRPRRPPADGRGQIVDAVSIRARPAAVADRAVPGIGKATSSWAPCGRTSATLVERQSRYVLLVKLPGKDTTSVVQALRGWSARCRAG